jgi:hypothetical protein
MAAPKLNVGKPKSVNEKKQLKTFDGEFMESAVRLVASERHGLSVERQFPDEPGCVQAGGGSGGTRPQQPHGDPDSREETA